MTCSCGSSANAATMALWCPKVRWVWSGVSTAVWAIYFFFDFFDVLELLAVHVCMYTSRGEYIIVLTTFSKQ